jgi:hypothetical protein
MSILILPSFLNTNKDYKELPYDHFKLFSNETTFLFLIKFKLCFIGVNKLLYREL